MSSRGARGQEQGPIEQQLDFQRKILTLEAEIRDAHRDNFISISLGVAVFCIWSVALLGIPGICIATYATYGHVDLGFFNRIAIPIAALCAIASLVLKFNLVELSDFERTNIAEKKLELSLAKERRRLYAANIDLDVSTQRHIYRETIPVLSEEFRRGSARYRRIHNGFQSVTIVGSFVMTALASMTDDVNWLSVGVSFAVGIASGFTGYFKFKERGFYLQQSADAIDQEVDAASLSIGAYKGKGKDESLQLFTERVEAIKVEQRKRQQQLDQPSDRSEAEG